MILAEHIDKSFGRHRALQDLSFEVGDGQIVALMGANGAGKSTLFDILATVDPAFGGRALIDGIDVRTHPIEARGHIGYVPGRFSLYGDLSVAENLDFFAKAYGCAPEGIESLSPHLWRSIRPFADQRAANLSGGMKQKLSICCAMVHNPSVLLLDEPTVGVDPLSRHDMWDELAALRAKGVTVLVSTHYLDEAAFADRILFLHHGRKLLFDRPDAIAASYRHHLYSIPCTAAELPQIEAALAQQEGILDYYLWGGHLHVATDGDRAGTPICGRPLQPVRPAIEDVFIDTLNASAKAV
jgi:ABC-type multidrug transport system ATPase subunit